MSLDRPGLYAWFCDESAARVNRRMLSLDITSLVKIGQDPEADPGGRSPEERCHLESSRCSSASCA